MIGYWLGPNAPDWPDVLDFVDPGADIERREIILTKLEAGTPTDWAAMGYSTCRVCGCLNGCAEFTDGVLVWPEGLAHYIRDHDVRLPDVVEAVLIREQVESDATLESAVVATPSDRDYEWWRSLRPEQ
jgi:hypothetical protein